MATAVVVAVAEAVEEASEEIVVAVAVAVTVAVPVMAHAMAHHAMVVVVKDVAVAVMVVLNESPQKKKCCKLGGFDQAFVLNKGMNEAT